MNFSCFSHAVFHPQLFHIVLFHIFLSSVSAYTCRRFAPDISWHSTCGEDAVWQNTPIREFSTDYLHFNMLGFCGDILEYRDIIPSSHACPVQSIDILQRPLRVTIFARVPCERYNMLRYDSKVPDAGTVVLFSKYGFRVSGGEIFILLNGFWEPSNLTISGNMFSDNCGTDAFHEFTFHLTDRKTELFYNDALLMRSEDRTQSGVLDLLGATETWWQSIIVSDNSCLSQCDSFACSGRGVPQFINNTGAGCDCLCNCNPEDGCFSGSDCSHVSSRYLGEVNCGTEPIGNPPIPLPFDQCVDMCQKSENCVYLGYLEESSRPCLFFSECFFYDVGQSLKYPVYQSDSACLSGPPSNDGSRYLKLLSNSTVVNGFLYLYLTLPEDYSLTQLEFKGENIQGDCGSLYPSDGCTKRWRLTTIGCLKVFVGKFNVVDMFEMSLFTRSGNVLMFEVSSTIQHHDYESGSTYSVTYDFNLYIILNTIIGHFATVEKLDGCEFVDCGPCMICERGRCELTNSTDGTECSDLNPLTVDDKCSNGICVGMEVCNCLPCERCEITDGAATCLPDASKDWMECSDGNEYQYPPRCQHGLCVGDFVICECSCSECSQIDCSGAPCCTGGECIQRNTRHPQCDSGVCDQAGSALASCVAGGCNQSFAMHPTCFGGYCIQTGAIRPSCDGGNCTQTQANLPTCRGGHCTQFQAHNPSCTGGGCEGNCDLMDCGCLSCFEGSCSGPPFRERETILSHDQCLLCLNGSYTEDPRQIGAPCGTYGECVEGGICSETVCSLECGPCQKCSLVSTGIGRIEHCLEYDTAGGCPPCETCVRGRCTPDAASEYLLCDNQIDDSAYGGRCDATGECISHFCAATTDLQVGSTNPCCPEGYCNQESAEHPSCLGGRCIQTHSFEPYCEGGYCVQTHSVRPSCQGGRCVGNCDFMKCPPCHSCNLGICSPDLTLDFSSCGDTGTCEGGVCVPHPVFIEEMCGPCQYWLDNQCLSNVDLEGKACKDAGRCEGGRCVDSTISDLEYTIPVPAAVELARLNSTIHSKTKLTFLSFQKNLHITEATPGDFSMSVECSSDVNSPCREDWTLEIDNADFCTSTWHLIEVHAENISHSTVSDGQEPARDSRFSVLRYNVSLIPSERCGVVSMTRPLFGEVIFVNKDGVENDVTTYYAGGTVYFSLTVWSSEHLSGLDVGYLILTATNQKWETHLIGANHDQTTREEMNLHITAHGFVVKWNFDLTMSVFNHFEDWEEIEVRIGVMPLADHGSARNIPVDFVIRFTLMRYRCVTKDGVHVIVIGHKLTVPCPNKKSGVTTYFCVEGGFDQSRIDGTCDEFSISTNLSPRDKEKPEDLPWIYNGFIGIFCFLVFAGILSSIFQRFRVSYVDGSVRVERRAQVKTLMKRGSRTFVRYNLSSMFGRSSTTIDKHSQALQNMCDSTQTTQDCGEDSESEDCRRDKVGGAIDPRLNTAQRAKARTSANRKQSLRDSVRISRSEKRASRIAPRRLSALAQSTFVSKPGIRRTSTRLSVRQTNGPRWGDLRRGSHVHTPNSMGRPSSRSTRMQSERVSRSEKRASRSVARSSRKFQISRSVARTSRRMSYSYSEDFSRARASKSRPRKSIGMSARSIQRNIARGSTSSMRSSAMLLYE